MSHFIIGVKKILIPILFVFCLSSPVAGQDSSSSSPAKEKVLLMEEFNDNDNTSAGWPDINHADTATAKIVNGHYVLDAKHAARFWALRLGIPDPLPAQPDILEMKMKVEGDSAKIAYGILWHTFHRSKSVFDEYAFLVRTDGSFVITRKEDGHFILQTPWDPCSCIHKKDYNILRIEQRGIYYRLFVNGTMVFFGSLIGAELTTMGFYTDAHSILSVDYLKLATRDTSP